MILGSSALRGIALGVVATLAGASVLGGVASAMTTAKSVKGDLLQTYAPCSAPTTMSNSGYNACLAPTVNDQVCKFGPRGKGTVKLVALQGDVKVLGVARSIDVGCEGQTLRLVMSAQITSDDCPPGAIPAQTCTLVDLVDYNLGTCTVSNGACIVLSNLNNQASLAMPNKRTHIVVKDCGFIRTTGSGSPVRTFSCGLKVP
jgi:hypothetical protein